MNNKVKLNIHGVFHDDIFETLLISDKLFKFLKKAEYKGKPLYISTSVLYKSVELVVI